jgi:hypothetical protein
MWKGTDRKKGRQRQVFINLVDFRSRHTEATLFQYKKTRDRRSHGEYDLNMLCIFDEKSFLLSLITCEREIKKKYKTLFCDNKI